MGLLRLFLSTRSRRLAALALAATTFATLIALLFIWPPSSLSRRADALVMFQGGEGERLERVLDLLEHTDIDVAIIPEGHVLVPDGLCGDHDRYRVICGTPAVANTAGEAAFAAAVAEAQGFETLAVVTSSYHVRRATQELEACFDGRVERAPAWPRVSWGTWAARIGHESVGLFQSMFRNDCVSPGWLLDGTPADRPAS